MEALVYLVTLGMAFIVFVAIFRRGTTKRPSDRRTIRVSDAATARRALIDHADAFSNRPMPPFPAGRPVTHSISSAPYGPFWRALRSNLAADILHRSRLGVLAPLEREAAEALVASLSAQQAGNGDVVVVPRNTLHGAVFALVARLCFGDGGGAMDARDVDLGAMLLTQREFLESFAVARASERSWLARLLHWSLRRRHAGVFDRVNEVFVPAVVAARRRRQSSQHGNGGGAGFRSHLDSLLELRVPNNEGDEGSRRLLTDEEVAFLAWEFLGGGTMSVLTCLEWTLAHLAAEPEIQSKLHREVAGAQDNNKVMAYDQLCRLPYLNAVVLESLRLHPPTPLATRHVHAEGVASALDDEPAVVPPGDDDARVVSFVLGDIGRDGEAWTDPDEFRPERFLEGGEGQGVSLVPAGPKEIKMMPFGAGRRHCPGVAMGMSHIKCFLAELVRGFEWVPPADGTGTDFAEVDGFRKMMKTPLRVRITPRSTK